MCRCVMGGKDGKRPNNVCRLFNQDKCTDATCGLKHCCIICGKKGAKFGHNGCNGE